MKGETSPSEYIPRLIPGPCIPIYVQGSKPLLWCKQKAGGSTEHARLLPGRHWHRPNRGEPRGVTTLTEELLLGIAAIIVLGIGAQWLAWRVRLPSILLLLVFGFIAGPLTGWIRPDRMLGDALFPFVSLAVAVILYEGGLSLRFSELRQVGAVVLRLISLGLVVTWLVAAVAAYYILRLSAEIAVLLGAILVVTGPTVIKPILRHVRPVGDVGSSLKWEGILIDPIGALLAVLVFEAIIAGEFGRTPLLIAEGLLVTMLIGTLVGLAGAGLLTILLRRYWIPDHLQNSVSLMLVVAAFAVSDILRPESGLLAVTIMGIALANQPFADVQHIVAFKEDLSVFLIAGLFILLAARLDLQEVGQLSWGVAAFLAALVVVARPLSVFLSTLGSRLNWQERAFLAVMAPRGIVAAAVSSLFALRLIERGHAGAEQLAPVTFATIVATVLVYGLPAAPIARWLGVAEEDPQGALLMGANDLAQEIGLALQKQGLRVLLVDTNRRNVSRASLAGLDAHHASPVADYGMEELNLDGIGRLLALTPNDEANSLAAVHFAEVFGRAEVYQLPRGNGARPDKSDEQPLHLRGRLLFAEKATYEQLNQRLQSGARIKATQLTEKFDAEDFQTLYQEKALPLFLITRDHQLKVFTTDSRPTPAPGQIVISLAEPTSDEPEPEPGPKRASKARTNRPDVP